MVECFTDTFKTKTSLKGGSTCGAGEVFSRTVREEKDKANGGIHAHTNVTKQSKNAIKMELGSTCRKSQQGGTRTRGDWGGTNDRQRARTRRFRGVDGGHLCLE